MCFGIFGDPPWVICIWFWIFWRPCWVVFWFHWRPFLGYTYLVLVFDRDPCGLTYSMCTLWFHLKTPQIILKHRYTLNHTKDICIDFLLQMHMYLPSLLYLDSFLSIIVLGLISLLCCIFCISSHWACQAHPNWHHLIDWDFGDRNTSPPKLLWNVNEEMSWVVRTQLMFTLEIYFWDMSCI